MDDISISLPCGFSAKYNEIYNSNAKFPCPVCNSHNLMRQECLDMTRNKLVINELHLNQKKNIFQQCLKNIEICKSDPKSSIDENYQNLKNQLDIRREEIKLIVVKKIDEYYEDLIKIMEEEKETKLKEFNTRIQQIPSLEKEIMDFKIENTTDMTKKLDIIDDFSDKIENGITFLNKVKNDLETNKWIFNPGDESLDIKGLFGKLDWKEETKVIQKTDHLNKMDNVRVILPCGFSVKYKDILNKSEPFPCPACEMHDITRQECLNMARNRLVLIEKSFELKKKLYKELLIEFDNYKNEPKIFLDESYDSLKKEVNLRRKNTKDLLNRMIDVYHDGLLKKIDSERDLKIDELNEKIQQTETLVLATLNIDKNLDIGSKLEFYKNNRKKIDKKDECMGFFLDFNSLVDTNEFSLKVNAVLSLEHKSDSNKNLDRTLTFFFTKKTEKHGCSFTTMNEILNSKNGYYDADADLISLKALIKTEFAPKIQ
ncbi:hypothetical protein BpHYR1_025643 [Brachionus plicatilis]|uniref:Uncharacterized protein n=1 Tax=Brachionus plicatilis TaxID=10195 RepID=A0A3M7SU76_BRAPC|nr:hypothetical protein BpHYR1_025643 [Brachionus plicatilis]